MVRTSSTKIPFWKTIGIGHDRDYFVENLSMLVASGMTIIDALDAVRSDIRTAGMLDIIREMRERVEGGSPLWRTLDDTGLFKPHTVSLIRIGEESGKLSENLRAVSLEQQKERILRSRIRSALMYPVFVLGLTVIIGTAVAWFILPKLATVFTQMHLKLPLVTKVLIQIGAFLNTEGFIAVPAFLIGLAVIIYILFFFPKTKVIGQTLLSVIPGIGRLTQEIELARLGYLLGTLLDAGLPIIQAIDSLAEAASSPPYKKFYRYLGESINEGNSFQKTFASYKGLNKLIPSPVQQLIVSGERSGGLSNVLLAVSTDYEEKSETTTKDLSVILEPVLLVVVWLGVVTVALAVILPIYSLVGGLQTS